MLNPLALPPADGVTRNPILAAYVGRHMLSCMKITGCYAITVKRRVDTVSDNAVYRGNGSVKIAGGVRVTIVLSMTSSESATVHNLPSVRYSNKNEKLA